jgi:hypothetical protein
MYMNLMAFSRFYILLVFEQLDSPALCFEFADYFREMVSHYGRGPMLVRSSSESPTGPSAGLLKRRYVVMLPVRFLIDAVSAVSATTGRPCSSQTPRRRASLALDFKHRKSHWRGRWRREARNMPPVISTIVMLGLFAQRHTLPMR